LEVPFATSSLKSFKVLVIQRLQIIATQSQAPDHVALEFSMSFTSRLADGETGLEAGFW
jgi:hypothetical protein